MVPRVSQELQNQFRLNVQPYLISWFKFDPADELARTNLSTLIIQGTNDPQVTLENGYRLARIHPDINFSKLIQMNHVLKMSTTNKRENYATYSKPMLKLAEKLIPTIVSFLKNCASSVSSANDR